MVLIRDLLLNTIKEFMNSERGGNSAGDDPSIFLQGKRIEIRPEAIIVEDSGYSNLDEKIYNRVYEGYYVYKSHYGVEFEQYTYFNNKKQAKDEYNRYKLNGDTLIYEKKLIEVKGNKVRTLIKEHI